MGVKLSIHGLHSSLVDPWIFKFDPFRVDTLFFYSNFSNITEIETVNLFNATKEINKPGIDVGF
jgi:hypothetical protein